MTATLSLEQRARAIAEYANRCCDRSDGYEEDVYALALQHLRELRLEIETGESRRHLGGIFVE